MDLLTIAISARGTTYGALTVARRGGDGFDADGRGVPRGLRAPGRGHPRHHPGAGRVAPGRRRALARPHPADAADARRRRVRHLLPGGLRARGPRRRLLRRARRRRRAGPRWWATSAARASRPPCSPARCGRPCAPPPSSTGTRAGSSSSPTGCWSPTPTTPSSPRSARAAGAVGDVLHLDVAAAGHPRPWSSDATAPSSRSRSPAPCSACSTGTRYTSVSLELAPGRDLRLLHRRRHRGPRPPLAVRRRPAARGARGDRRLRRAVPRSRRRGRAVRAPAGPAPRRHRHPRRPVASPG